MAEAVAAFYTIETAVEGAALGAFAVSQSTVPLHIRFRQLVTPLSSHPWKATASHSLDVVKGKAYIFGGDAGGEVGSTVMRIVTLPSDIENGEPDFQIVEADLESERPLEQFTSSGPPTTDTQGFENLSITGGSQHSQPQPKIQQRASHSSTSIGSDVFVLAGRSSNSLAGSNNTQLFACDHICKFSTVTNKWLILRADTQNSKSGVPLPRTNASCSSSPHPQPDSAIDVTIHAHGTIFLHGGYDAQGQALRDTWAFDVSSRVWTRLPDIPDPLAEEVAGEGRVACVGQRLWRVGDGFGKMTYLDFDVLRGNVVGATSGPHSAETGIAPSEQKWQVLTFGEKATDATSKGGDVRSPEKPLLDKTENLPVPRRGAGFLSVQVGAGRSFLLYFMGSEGPHADSALGDVWSFQIKAEGKSPAAVKDAVRSAIGKDTGENEWARCEIIESTKEEGQVHPPQGLVGFAADGWKDLGGGHAVLWGGVDASGQVAPQCWVMSVE